MKKVIVNLKTDQYKSSKNEGKWTKPQRPGGQHHTYEDRFNWRLWRCRESNKLNKYLKE
jgi:hypothetical protein